MPSFVDIFITENAEKLKTTNGRERLSLLAQFLKLIPKDRFELRDWAEKSFSSDNCGTSACACGWATVIFPELQLTNATNRFKNLKYGNHIGWFAVEAFFDLTEYRSYMLFSYHSYSGDPTPNDVVDRIEEFLKAEVDKASVTS